MVGFEKEKAELDVLGIKVVAASVDDEDKAKEVADEVSFPVGFSATQADGDSIGAWWGDTRGIIQPSEFVIGEDGKVVSATYSSGPIGRVNAADVVKLVTFYEKRKRGEAGH